MATITHRNRNLMTEDIRGAQANQCHVQDPLDPMCLNKPYPDLWLVNPSGNLLAVKKKPGGGLVTNRRTNPLDPKYTLPSGPSTMPSGFYEGISSSNKVYTSLNAPAPRHHGNFCAQAFFASRNSFASPGRGYLIQSWIGRALTVGFRMQKWTNRTFSQNLRNNDIEKSTSKSYYAKPCRCILPGENVPDPWRGCKPKKWTWMRNRMFYGAGLELHDIDIGKRYKGFVRQRPSNPLEPLYPTEPEETPEIKYRRLKFRRLPPRRRKTDPCEKALDHMYWKAEQLPRLCHLNGQPQPKDNTVTFDAFRYTLETLGLYYTDDEFERLKPHIDPDKSGSVRYLNLSKQLRHNDGFHIDIPKPLGFDMGYWGMPSTLGQGLNVLEHVPKYGKKCPTWVEHEQIYNPLTGIPVPVWTHKPRTKPLDYGWSKSPSKYDYLNILGKIQEDDRAIGRSQYEYFPSGPAPHKKLSEIEPPTMPERKVSLASAGVNQRPEWCQHWDSLPEADLTTHTCEKPADKDFHLATLEMAKEVGAMVRRNTANEVRARQDSKLYMPKVPQNNARGSQVNWIPVVDRPRKGLFNKFFIPQNVRMANEARTADIETVKALQVID